MDWNEILYDPVYAVLAVEATLTPTGGAAVIIDAVDKTAGFDVNLGGVELPSIKPVAFVRMAELAAHNLTLEQIKDAALQLGANRWLIKATKQRPGPDGKGSGEAMLILLNENI